MFRTILLLLSFLFCMGLYAQQVITHGPRDEKLLALTVDDGWDPDWELIQFLEDEDVPWTAFIPGVLANQRPEWVTYMAELGVPVGNHGYSHHWLTAKSDEEIYEELLRTKELLIELTGSFCPYFRPSAAKYDQRVLDIADELGYKVILWDNDVGGYTDDPKVEDQLDYMMSQLQAGNIILSHFGDRLNTREVLSRFIPMARSMGYRFVSLDELLDQGA